MREGAIGADEEGKELVWQITEALAGTEVGGGNFGIVSKGT